MNTAQHYARIRRAHPNTAAANAYRWAQQEAEIDALEAECEYGEKNGATVMVARGLEVTIEWDTEPYDWGDCEPTEDERADLEVIVVSARATSGAFPGGVVDAIGGVGYFASTSSAEREAWRVALDSGWFEDAAEINGEHDAFERAAAEYAGEWFARRASAGGGFVDALFDLCAVADTAALERLMVAFPELVGAWRARKGA